MITRSILFVVVAIFILMPDFALAQGCSMCKAVVENGVSGSGPGTIGHGLNMGILYLMAVPYLLLFLLFRKRIVAFFKEFAGAQG
ncbi:MAG: hypothetical protein IPI00_13160 [Flavobacteriales bacterium]|nr:hypothetical protein [Flavobacteriales bacterium]MBK6944769.1 hypothetical protein [Flavobacteriales bacterium]MBK7241084.1 hypothetical protein [Flavobacteriales bacterium]MBK7295770.1 hypothetical protein [Flavobacteriales bacterium]MBK9534424.1 hypothetical protein [Flavobacteriales bacterium]